MLNETQRRRFELLQQVAAIGVVVVVLVAFFAKVLFL